MIRFRSDVEGLRGVAVLLVVLAHLDIPGFAGGFFGVDVFFVISGYLITSLLAAELARTGSVSVAAFYARRIRRIVPAALTVAVAVVAASGALLNELRVAQVHRDALWAAFFAANVHFAREATDYFAQASTATSPFQHFWSLAVEEQFYLVWPALFVLSARGGADRWRGRVAVLLCVIGGGSFAWSAAASDDPGAYYSTRCRAWELALGAFVGVVTTSESRLPPRAAAAASSAGTALLVVAFAVIGRGTPFPGDAAALPTLAAVLLIVGGLGRRTPLPNRLLALAPLRLTGRISYSIYLWHWPLVVFAAARYPSLTHSVELRALILAATFAVATLSYLLVERPARKIIWARRGPGRAGTRRNVATATYGACLLVVCFVGLVAAIRPEGSAAVPLAARFRVPQRTPNAVVFAVRTPRDDAYATALRAWQRVIRAALNVRRLPPSLRPIAPHLERAFPPPCRHGLRAAVADECVVGNPRAPNVAVLNGDSHAEMFRNSVWRAFDRRTWAVHIFARDACGWAGGAENAATTASDCARRQAAALRRIRALHPDVLLLSEHYVVAPFRSRADIASALAAFTHAARKTIVLGHTPLPHPWDTCLVGVDISRCFTVLDTSYRNDVAVERTLSTRAGATFVGTSAWLCFLARGRGTCPPVIAGVPAFKDDTHVSAEYQLKLVHLVRALLVADGVGP